MDKVKHIRQCLQAQGAQAFLGSNPVNRRYLTNFTGSAGFVWISEGRQALLTDFRYIEQSTAQCPDWEIIRIDDLMETLPELVREDGVEKIAFEADHVTIHQLEEWQEKVPCTFEGITGWVQDVRMIKSEAEIEAISRAAQIADAAFAQVLGMIRSGVTEQEIALELEFLMRRGGASGVSFDPIVASGPRSALPHARPGERILSHGDFVVMDFGCIFDGYCSDMTRTLIVGEPTEEHLLIYDLVLKAQLEALAAVEPGRTGKEVDGIARSIISEGGYGEYFGHGLGHGVGLEIHEGPRLSQRDDTPLQPGMIVTVEPGIYLPDFGGVRIEDLVLVTDDGHRVLSSTFKELYVVE